MKDLFEDAVCVAPPSTVDVDRLIARRRRIRWLQRLGGAGLAVTAVAAIGVVTTMLPEARTAPTAKPGVSASPPANPVDETLDQRAARYSAALRAILAERLPGVTVAGSFDVQRVTRPGVDTTTGATVEEHYYFWNAMVTDPSGTAELSLTINNRQEGLAGRQLDDVARLECPSTRRGRESCEVTNGPNGEKIRRRVTDLNTYGRDPQILVSVVEVTFADLTSIRVSCPHGGRLGASEPGVGQGDEVLTLDELTAVGTDPRLAW